MVEGRGKLPGFEMSQWNLPACKQLPSSLQGLYDTEDDEESVSPLPSKQMKITTTNSFLHNSVRGHLSSPHHAMLTLHGHRGCLFTGLSYQTVLLKSVHEVFSSNICFSPHSSFVPMLLLLFLEQSSSFRVTGFMGSHQLECVLSALLAGCSILALSCWGTALNLFCYYLSKPAREAFCCFWRLGIKAGNLLLCKNHSKHLVGEDCCSGEDGISVQTNVRSCFWHGMALCSLNWELTG